MEIEENMKDPGWQYLRIPAERAAILPDYLKTYDSKKSCWIPDPEEGFIPGVIKGPGPKADTHVVISSKGGAEVVLKKDLCQEMNPPKFERTEDMSNLTMLNDASVLHNLRRRYCEMCIYTYSGLFCVVINPYKRLPIYTESVVKMYMGKRKNEMPPHLFANSDEAYRNMLQDRENQSMLITGESGAGKTENTKKVISYFAVVGATQQAVAVAPGAKHQATLEEQIVQTNPVLESFGNAKTVRNNNSSRFGKFIRVHFDRTGKMAGGDIEHYLLEKSRAIKQNPGERCYHIFYQIMSGYVPDMRKKLLLDKDVKAYHFVAQAEVTIEGVNDKEEMQLTDEAFEILGFTETEKWDMFYLCAGLMHMGEMKFKQRGEQAEPEDDIEEAKKTCACFGVPHDQYLKALTTPRVKVGNEWVNKGQTVEQVNWGIGAMAKGIYARQFTWLVSRCNKTLDAVQASRDFFIGVLDIAGFEIFDYNSFEQMWINFVNEKLQQFFNHHMFVLEQEEYQREGIVWTFIDFGLDLQATIELIEKPLGIISMLDEECIVPKATDLTYAEKLSIQHLGKHPNFVKPPPPKGKQADAHFAVKHYAGTVRYNVTAWLEKNKDPLNDTCIQVMKNHTKNNLLQACWKEYQTQEEQAIAAKEGQARKKGKSGSFMTVSMMYRESLNNLMNMLHKTHPHFIRCIIPNEVKKAGLLDAALVMNQLTCNGVLEGIRICRKGFPNRMLHEDFKQRYSILAPDRVKNIEDVKEAGPKILNKLKEEKKMTDEMYRIGHTKVFFKAGVLAHLEDLRDERLSHVIALIQGRIRYNNNLIEKKDRMKQRGFLLVIQRNISSWNFLREWNWFLLFGKLRPTLKCGKMAEEMAKMKDKIKELEGTFGGEIKIREKLEAIQAKLISEKNEMFMILQSQKDGTSNVEEKMAKLAAQRDDLEKQVHDMIDRLADMEDKGQEGVKARKKIEAEQDTLRKQIEDLQLAVEKSQAETASREQQIKNLQDEMAQQDELIAKFNKEKKHQDEVNRKVGDDLQAEEDKQNHLNKVKAKLELSLDELEDQLEREKRVRQDIEKVQRKVESELRLSQEKIDDLNKRKQDSEANLRKKEAEIIAINTRLEDERALISKLQKQIKELQARAEEIEEELANERQARTKIEKARSEVQRQLEELQERLEEAGGLTAAQVEINKKREAELAKLRKDLEEANQNHEAQLGLLRKKHNDTVVEMGEQLDVLQKQKAKSDKDKALFQREIDDLKATLDSENKSRQNVEKNMKQLELQLGELNTKKDDQAKQINELTSLKGRLASENAEITKQIESSESQANALTRVKTQLTSQLEEAKRSLEEEVKEKQTITAQIRNFEHDCNTAREQIEEQVEARAETLRQLSKVNSEIQLWRTKFESEGLAKTEELEESRRKMASRLQEYIETLEQNNVKIMSLEKVRQRLAGEVEDAQVDVERSNQYANALEKKQKGFDKILDEWKRKYDDLRAECDASARDNRNLGTEAFKLKGTHDELSDQNEVALRENKSLAQEIKDLSDQLADGGKSVHELQKLVNRLQLEKDELQGALDECESALEAEESKVLRTQIEVAQIRQEIEKRIAEKEEEFENTRKNHQKSLDSMQASLEFEVKGKAELLRIKKKLESDINELEIALDHANRANEDAQKNIRLYQDRVRELQGQVEVEQRNKDELRELCNQMDRRCAQTQAEKEEFLTALDQVERARRQVEQDLVEAREQMNDVNGQNQSLNMVKRQLETELQSLISDLDENLLALKTSEDQSKKAMMDAARLAEELRQEQDHTMMTDRTKKALEAQLKDIQLRLDEAEAAALKGGKKIIAKLEQRIRELETELDGEQRRHAETMKNSAKLDRNIRDVQFQIDEGKKNAERTQDLIEKLQQKLKIYKKQVEEAEEVAAVNFAKFKQIQQQVDDATERADVAENSLDKLRAKNRSATEAPMARSASSAGVLKSATTKPRSGSFV